MLELVAVYLILVSATSESSDISVIRAPVNTASCGWNNVRLSCHFTNITSHNESTSVQWYQYVTSASGQTISSNDSVAAGYSRAKYVITGDHVTGQFDLVIKNFLPEDSGTYMCCDTWREVERLAEVIYVERPTCYPSHVAGYDVVPIACSVKYRGLLVPKLNMTDSHGRIINCSNDVTSNNVTCTALLDLDDGVSEYTCQVYFTAPSGGVITDDPTSGKVHDQTAPSYTASCNVTVLNEASFDKPTIQLPVTDTLHVNQSLICTAEGALGVSWTVTLGNSTIHVNGSSLLLTENMVGSAHVVCTAWKLIGGNKTTLSAYLNITIDAKSHSRGLTESSGESGVIRREILIVILSLVAFFFVCVVVAILLHVFVTRGRNKHDDDIKEPKDPPVTREDRTTEDISAYYQERWEISRDAVTLKVKLCTGDFGEWWVADLQRSKQKVMRVMVKVITGDVTLEASGTLVREFSILRKLSSHVNVIKPNYCCTKEEPLMLVVDVLAGTSLHDYVKKKCFPATGRDITRMTLAELYDIAIQVAQGMAHVNKYKVVHRCLSAKNVLITPDIICKLCELDKEDPDGKRQADVWETNPELIRWMPPERLFRRRHVTQGDVWSFSILLSELITGGGLPYDDFDLEEIKHGLLDDYRLPRPEGCPEQIYNLMEQCWQEDPAARPTFDLLVSRMTSQLKACKKIKHVTSDIGESDGELVNGGALLELMDIETSVAMKPVEDLVLDTNIQ